MLLFFYFFKRVRVRVRSFDIVFILERVRVRGSSLDIVFIFL